jgi:hypothetical protein
MSEPTLDEMIDTLWDRERSLYACGSDSTRTFRAIRNTLERLRDEQHAGLSWNGFNVYGDKKSIEEVKRIVEFEIARALPSQWKNKP